MPAPMRVSLPASLRDWVNRQVRQRGYGTADEYVVELLRHDQLREARDHVDAKLTKALQGGESLEMTTRDWNHIRNEGRKRAAARRRAKG